MPEMIVIEQGNQLDFSRKNAGLAGNKASAIRHPMDCSKNVSRYMATQSTLQITESD